MIFTTFYFSGTGNTKWTVNELHQIALGKKHQSNVYSIEELPENLGELIQKSDFIGIAFPIYAMNMPEIMRQFLQRVNQSLSDNNTRKSLFIITTVGFADGCGPYEVIRQISTRNFKLKGYISIKIANNISTPMAKGTPISPIEMNTRLEKGKMKIARLIETLESGKKKIDLGVYLIAGFFRKKMNNIVKDAYKQLSIDQTTCKKCMHCVTHCPSKSIEQNNGKMVIQPTCTACMRCFNICPTYSIWHGGKYADPNEFIRYKGPKAVLDKGMI